MHDISEFARARDDAVTEYEVRYVDRTLPGPDAVRAALRDDGTVDTDRLRSALATVGKSVADWNERGRYADSEYGSDLRTVR
ncbi:hypothetical protein M0R89_10535 [Halorussus limi]|uniref:Uncharacterized protein n=1 Tax=Halorussus limi TaxID=2938695 RepID=A0A8U0HPL2_9EURY|nr:hypothetical protein [Halorussus limi]UPV72985.1 hypothetical protein M0R89_10535 [Halorussus limi]